MSENFLLTLPPDAPQEFAKALRLLAEAALPPNTPHDQAVKYLYEQTKIRTELLYPWFKGNLDGVGGNPESGKGRSKKFTPYYFEKLVRFFWGRKGGLQTYEEALAFAQAAGEEFVAALQEEWFTELQEKSRLNTSFKELAE